MFRRILGYIFYFEAIILYFMFFGTTETTVNVRAANRGIAVDMGVTFFFPKQKVFYLESAFIFALTKNSVYVLVLMFLNFRMIEGNENVWGSAKNVFLQITKSFFVGNLVVLGGFCVVFEWMIVLQVERELKSHLFCLT